MAASKPNKPPTSGISTASFYSSRALQGTRAEKDRRVYRIVEELPSVSSDDDDCVSDEDWLPPGKQSKTNNTVDDSESEPEEDDGALDAEEEADSTLDEPPEPPLSAKAKTKTPQEPPLSAKAPKRKYVWKHKDAPWEGRWPAFSGEWTVNVHATEPVEFFMHLFPEELIEHIVLHTNLYALQKGKENLALTNPELKTFLGINLAISYIRYPKTRMYWSSEQGLRCDMIANAMSVNRFEQILRYLHFADNATQQPGEDKLVKIRPVLDTLQKTFLSAVDPEECQSIDEMIIPFKGQLSIKQYIPKKPKPWGVKVWVRAGGSSGYVYRFEVYQGAAINVGISQLGLAADVILRLCDDIQHKNHKVFFDNFFCTIQLIALLKQQGIYSTGTCRTNRLQGAQEKLKNIAQRWSKKEKKVLNIKRPFSVKVYNEFMGGVDQMDQMVAMYPHRRKNKRWYIRIFFHFLDVTVVNAWHLLRMSGLEQNGLLSFKASVARALINAGSIQIRKRGRPSENSPPPLPVKRKVVSKVPPELSQKCLDKRRQHVEHWHTSKRSCRKLRLVSVDQWGGRWSNEGFLQKKLLEMLTLLEFRLDPTLRGEGMWRVWKKEVKKEEQALGSERREDILMLFCVS
ncbi:piggyBac transposable element-derived protein 3-like [Melanotaenia boesemani]|uniref:piggyBac transposable element-derived protein 3-like n=1 Tax=Melanotaenia boesemani TaxID=1250792 RepID=UPI001C0516CD|nr:piggyBac transposable element-derived protein 3-like [Melanotaenia boesemani]